MQEYFRRETLFRKSFSGYVQHALNGKIVFFVCSNVGQSLPIWPSWTHALLSLHGEWNYRAVTVVGGSFICRKTVERYGGKHCSASQIINQTHLLLKEMLNCWENRILVHCSGETFPRAVCWNNFPCFILSIMGQCNRR